ncbi:MAG: type I-E CRISPR-associated protein Cse2/CasB [Anaerolineaceae bacterium]|nr:type I-E CRISPR-associated protein Cse2/CasB [Anaerolineaceae bacterium]
MTTISKSFENRFINYLLELSQGQQRGELAVLRRGLSQPPANDVAMYPYVARFIPEKLRGSSTEKVYYLIAALFAYHPLNTLQGNFGAHMHAAANEANQESTERRFVVLLNAHVDDLPDYLRQAVSYLKSKEIAVNWEALFNDLKQWSHPNRYIQRRWANSFWGYAPVDSENINQTVNQ